MSDFFGKITSAVSDGARKIVSATETITKTVKTGIDQVQASVTTLARQLDENKDCAEAYPGAEIADKDFYAEWPISNIPNPATLNILSPSVPLFAKDFQSFAQWVAQKGKSVYQMATEHGAPLNPICLDTDKGYYIPEWLQKLFGEYVSDNLDPAKYGIAGDFFKKFTDSYWGEHKPNFWVSTEDYPSLPPTDLRVLHRDHRDQYIFSHVSMSEVEIDELRVILGDSLSSERSFFKAGAPDKNGLREIAVSAQLDPERYEVWVKFLSHVVKSDINHEEKLRVGYLLSQFGEIRGLREFVPDEALSAFLASPAYEKIKDEYRSLYDRYYMQFKFETPRLPLPLGPYLSASDYEDKFPPAILQSDDREQFGTITEMLYPSDLISLLQDIEAPEDGDVDPILQLDASETLKQTLFRRVPAREHIIADHANTPQFYAVVKKAAPLFAEVLKLRLGVCAENKKCGPAYTNQLNKLHAAFSAIDPGMPEQSHAIEIITGLGIILAINGFTNEWLRDVYRRVVTNPAQEREIETAFREVQKRLERLEKKEAKRKAKKNKGGDDDPPTSSAGASATAGASAAEQTVQQSSSRSALFYTGLTGIAGLMAYYLTLGGSSSGGMGGGGAAGGMSASAGAVVRPAAALPGFLFFHNVIINSLSESGKKQAGPT